MAADPNPQAVVRVTARGLEFDVLAGGPPTGPPVLLLHGFPQHSAEWELVVPALHAAGVRTYALDQRGYSRAARPPAVAGYRLKELVADALAVLDQLDVESAHVVGHDWGAAVGWLLAIHHPDRVRTLTAVSVPHPTALLRALRTDGDQRRRSSYIAFFKLRWLPERVLLARGGALLRRVLRGLDPDRVDRYLDRMREPGALAAGLNWYRANGTGDFAGLGHATVPTAYVWSDRDPALGPTVAGLCGEYVVADYQYTVLPGVGHWIPEQSPADLAEAILARIA